MVFVRRLFRVCLTLPALVCVCACTLACVADSLSVVQVSAPRMDMTLAELQEMAARQQQQIDAQQQLLASKVTRAGG